MLVIVVLALSFLVVVTPTKAGTLTLVKGSWDTVGLDHNNVADGPNQYPIQIHVTNSAGTTATNVTGTLTWNTVNAYIYLAPNETAVKTLGDIAPGATVDLFYLIEVGRDSNAYNTTRDYTITVSGDNTGAPADTITGTLLVERLRSQARNEVVSIVASTTTPTVGDTFTVTVSSETGASNYTIVNLPASEYNPTVIEPVGVTVTFDTTTSNNVRLDLPNSDVFTSVWTFRAVAPGTSGITSFITDESGGSFHYNADFPDTITITVRGKADLRLEKTVDNPTPNIGDNVTFTITVYNDGPNAATNVAVEDILPAGLTYVSDTPSQGTYNNVTGIWTVGTINSGASATLQITAQVTGSGTITNIAQVNASDQYDPDSIPDNDNPAEDDQDSASITVQQADLRMEKIVDNASPNVGDNVTFTITVYNDGPDAATNVTVEDILPAGLTYVSDTPSQGSYNNVTGIWTVGTLNNGATATLQITAQVTGSGTITNTAQVETSDQYDPDSTPGNSNPAEDDQKSASITVQQADLRMDKTVDDPTPGIGDNVTFTITVYNDGPDAATNVAVEDILPAGLTYVSDTPSQGTYNNVTGIWTVGTINSGASATLQITAQVTSTGTITNIAQVNASDQYDPDSTPDNDNPAEDDQDSAVITAEQADLRMEKIVDNPTPNVGDNVTFTITVYNDGPDAATNVAVEDILPAGLTYVSDTPSQGTYNNVTGIWTVGTINSGASATLQITAQVTGTGAITNIAQVNASDQYDPDSTPDNDNPAEDDQDSTTVTTQAADLRMEKTVDNPTPNVGDNVTFTITVYNDGPDAATNVAVEDILPAGLTYVSDTPSQGTYNNVTGIWTVGTINNGASATLQITAQVTGTGAITNIAQVNASDQYDPDSTPDNDNPAEDDQDSAVINAEQADLRMEKTVDNPTPNVGDNVTFTITVYNDGPSAATNVAVEDILPAGLTYVSDTPSQGTYNNVTGIWTVGTVNNGASATLQITAQVAGTGTITNIAQVNASDQYDSDSTPDNDNPAEDDQGSAVISTQAADLRMEKSVNNPTPNVGDNVTFTITVYNDGPSAATNVAVEDILPAGLTYVSDTPSQGTYNNVTGIWTVGTINSGASATLQITAQVTGTGTITNIAQVNASDQYDPDSTPDNDNPAEDDQDSVSITVQQPPQQADLRMEKTVDNPAPKAGDNVIFTITVYNDGPNAATNVAVEDILPAGLTYVSDTPSQGTYNNVTGIWTVGTINSGASATLQITAQVTGSGTLTNIAQVNASDQFDPDSTPDNDNPREDDQHSATITVAGEQAPAINIVKSVSPPTAAPGDLVLFTLTVTNTGGVPLNPIVVVDNLPKGLTYANAANIPPDTVTLNPDGTTTLTWNNVGPLNAGMTISISFYAVFNGIEQSARNVSTATGTPPTGAPVSDEDFVIVSVAESGTPYQPQGSMQPVAYNRMMDCYARYKELIERIRRSGVEVQWDRTLPCCENLHNLVDQLIKMVLEKGLDKVYPEKWARVQELLPFLEKCCQNVQQYYDAGNYVASNYWSIQRDEAYEELVELLLEMLGF